ncbi:MAG: P1 family peptidase [Erysipelotrichaceae bacterium]|nr:P1 family peptidase [Erysipelotrichaceae bacterium]MDY5251823.1 P1 family peptidase [Erysipelotrichaceae bacterium]
MSTLTSFGLGHVSDQRAKTGCSVIYFPQGANVGCAIMGGGPASRETMLADPLTAANKINALVLAGGSAFGLAASDGVMQCLKDHDIGLETGFAKIPLVIQSDIYDLGYGANDRFPDAKMGYEACLKAMASLDEQSGNIGAGCGATVGKIMGMKQASKTGWGFYHENINGINVWAMVALNALGDVYDPSNGQIIAGALDPKRQHFVNTDALLKQSIVPQWSKTNTTIGAVITDAAFDKSALCKLAQMTSCAYARCISPVFTMMDGDTIYACSIGDKKVDINVMGTIMARSMEQALLQACKQAKITDEEFLKYCR